MDACYRPWQGFVVEGDWWLDSRRSIRQLMGNSMAISVVQGVLVQVLQALKHAAVAHDIQDPWLTGIAQRPLAHDARACRIPRFQHGPTLAIGPMALLGFGTTPMPNWQTRRLLRYAEARGFPRPTSITQLDPRDLRDTALRRARRGAHLHSLPAQPSCGPSG